MTDLEPRAVLLVPYLELRQCRSVTGVYQVPAADVPTPKSDSEKHQRRPLTLLI